MEPPRVALGGPAAVVVAGLLVASTYALVAAAGALAAALHGATFQDALAWVQRDPNMLALAQLGGAGVALAVGARGLVGPERGWAELLGLRRPSLSLLALAAAAGLGLALPLHELAVTLAALLPPLAPDPEEAAELARMLRIDGPASALSVTLAFVVVPALSEELLFRGLLLPGLQARHGPRAALAGSALLFGAVHLDPLAFVYATAAGLALGWVRLRVRSLWPCVAMHGAFNGLRVGLPPSLIRLRGFNTVEERVYHLPLGLVLGSLAMTLVCLYALGRRSGDR